MNIDDLSYSTISHVIQGDNKTACILLTKIAEEKEIVDNNYKDVEIKLNQLKTRQLQLKKGALGVLKHLKRETPFCVIKEDFIIVISDENISKERNVINGILP